jgi:hypothetical protein
MIYQYLEPPCPKQIHCNWCNSLADVDTDNIYICHVCDHEGAVEEDEAWIEELYALQLEKRGLRV